MCRLSHLGTRVGRSQERVRAPGGGSWLPWPLGLLQEEQVGTRLQPVQRWAARAESTMWRAWEQLDQGACPLGQPLTHQLGSDYWAATPPEPFGGLIIDKTKVLPGAGPF